VRARTSSGQNIKRKPWGLAAGGNGDSFGGKASSRTRPSPLFSTAPQAEKGQEKVKGVTLAESAGPEKSGRAGREVAGKADRGGESCRYCLVVNAGDLRTGKRNERRAFEREGVVTLTIGLLRGLKAPRRAYGTRKSDRRTPGVESSKKKNGKGLKREI